jgi:osmotically-inducible protein OsmY
MIKKNNPAVGSQPKLTLFIMILYTALTVWIFLNEPAAAAPTLEDAAITDAVENELLSDRAVPFDRINVTTADGIVTLTGRVNNILARERAVKIARVVKGVKSVVDRIEMVPTFMRSDIQIKKDIEESLLFNPATETYEITVQVDAFEATLSGRVDSRREKMLAETLAKGIKGVIAVQNEIDVKETEDRSDPAILADVEQALKWNVMLDDGLIDVEVKNGEVILTGTVGSASEKNLAINHAWVNGVKSVDAKGLEVERWARDDELRGDKYVVKSDVDIRKAVEHALLIDPRVSAADVVVGVRAGLVSLRGSVESLEAKRAAVRDAENTVGVLRVRNHLKVKPVSEISDREIGDNIRKAMIRDTWLSAFEVDVKVIDNIVYLNGNVNTYFEKARADTLASAVRGVRDIVNNLNVYHKYSAYTYDPYVDDWDIRDYDWYDFQPKSYSSKLDREIEAEIRDEFFWSPFVDSDKITVSVENGIATLTGAVDTKSDRSMAEANAYEGGASQVINNLEVR